MNTSVPLLELDGLVVEVERAGVAPAAALDGLSLTLAPGEMLGLVGESGAGKSLAGAALLGLLPTGARQTGGEIRFEGRRIDTLAPSALQRLRGRRLGAIFQDPSAALDPLRRVGAQLVETLQVHHRLDRRQAQARALVLLDEVGLPSPRTLLDRHPHQLSGGQRQRVVIALALAGEPALLVADEPTTALDVMLQAQVTALLRRLCRRRGTAVLLITHDLGVVAETCDRVAVLHAGRLVEHGPVEAVLRAPAHPYTRALLACTPTLDAAASGLPRLRIEGLMPRPHERPAGCAFHPRCAQAVARCRTESPPAPPPVLPSGQAGAACWLAPVAEAPEGQA